MPADLDTLRGLLTKVEAATGPDREFDARIAVTLCGWCLHERTTRSGYQDDTGHTCDACGADSWGNRSKTGQRLYDQVPPITASIDSAVALLERVLPGWDFMLYREDDGRYTAEMTWPDGALLPVAAYTPPVGLGATRALAITAGILEAALIAQQEDRPHG